MKVEVNLKPVMDMTVREVERIDYEVMKAGGSAKAGIDQQKAIAAMAMWQQMRNLRFTDKGTQMKISDFLNLRQNANEEFIHIHRLNYMSYSAIQDIYDWLEDKKRLTPNVKRYWKQIERTFSDYQKIHCSALDKSAWATVQDHMRLATDRIRPLIEPLEFAIRDYLIQKRADMLSAGQRDDISMLTKFEVGLMFCAALRNTYKQFFARIIHDYGVDLSYDFRYADIGLICNNYSYMMRQLGVKSEKDADGDYQLVGVRIDRSVRVDGAWNKIVSVVTNPDVMDETALEAIYMNPETKKDYERIIADAEKKELGVALGSLESKFKVGRL